MSVISNTQDIGTKEILLSSLPPSEDDVLLEKNKASYLSMELLLLNYKGGFVCADKRSQLLEYGVDETALKSIEHDRVRLLGGGKLPVIDEIGRSFTSLGDVITGNSEKAGERWHDWEDTSFIGTVGKSTGNAVSSVFRKDPEAARKDLERAENAAKGLARATGSILTGGGMLRNVPVFDELGRAGDSLGDAMAGESYKAGERWGDWADTSFIGTGGQLIGGNPDAAEGFGRACASTVITVGAIGASIATAGAAAPLGVAAATGAGAIVGGATSAGAAVAESVMHGRHIDDGEVVGRGIMGTVGGGIAGRVMVKNMVRNAARDEYFAGKIKPKSNMMTDRNPSISRSGIVSSNTRDTLVKFPENEVSDRIANDLVTNSKWVRIPSGSDNARQMLSKGDDIIIFEHIKLGTFGLFANAIKGLDYLSKILKKEAKDKKIDNIGLDLLQCEFNPIFAAGQRWHTGTVNRTLPQIPGAKLYMTNAGIFKYGPINNKTGLMDVRISGPISDLPKYLVPTDGL